MIQKAFITLATLFALGQGAWADGTASFPLHYNSVTNPEDGSEARPYHVESTGDLNTLASDVNKGIDYDGKHFILTADIDYSGVALFDSDEDGTADSNFTTIGYGDEAEGANFKGVFNGNGKYIKGITVNTPAAVGVALFGYIHQPAEIRNVTLKDCSFTGNFEVGAIVGATSGAGTNSKFGIYDCTVESTVKVTAVATTIDGEDIPGTYAGGIVGFCGSLIVKDCTSAAVVKGDESVGGIAGHFTGSALGGVIENSFFTGSVTGGSEATEVGNIVGGRGPIDGEEGTIGTINLTLLDNDASAAVKNATRIANYNGLVANVTLNGRTLYKDGKWNTLCLPFGVKLAGSALADAEARPLSSASTAGTSLSLTFGSAATTLTAGTPYIIKWESASNIVSPTFSGVTVSTDKHDYDTKGTSVTTAQRVRFTGTYTSTPFAAEDKSILLMSGDNKLYYPAAGSGIAACRAYFKIGNDGSTLTQQLTAFNIDFEEVATGVKNVDVNANINQAGAWYTIDGRRVNVQLPKGIYINNGKKVVIE